MAEPKGLVETAPQVDWMLTDLSFQAVAKDHESGARPYKQQAVILVTCSPDWSWQYVKPAGIVRWLAQEIIRDCLEEAEESFPEEVHIQDSFGPD